MKFLQVHSSNCVYDQFISIQLMLNLILGFFSGIIFFQSEDDGPNVISDRCVCTCVCACVCVCVRVWIQIHALLLLYIYTRISLSYCRAGALFFCLICNLFSVSSGLELFISERPLFM